jgi:antitoxin YefM
MLDAATTDHEVVVIKRRGAEDVAMVAASELRGLEETAHLLRSPANAKRLIEALERALASEGRAMNVEQLRSLVGLDEAD